MVIKCHMRIYKLGENMVENGQEKDALAYLQKQELNFQMRNLNNIKLNIKRNGYKENEKKVIKSLERLVSFVMEQLIFAFTKKLENNTIEIAQNKWH